VSGRVLLGLLLVAAAPQEPPLAAVPAEECRPRRGLPNVLEKLKGTGEVKVAYLGGSITAAPGWRVKSLDWLQRQHPGAKLSEIHAAIGGTGSDLGVFRLRRDVLRHGPDLLFVEFAVNDGGAPPERIQQAIEGIVRQTRRADPRTDVCFVYTLAQNQLQDLQRGVFQRSASAMEAVADRYGIPSIHFGVDVARRVTEGSLIFKGEKPKDFDPAKRPQLFSTDAVHPLIETGHELYLQSIVRSWEPIQAASGPPGPHPLPGPLREDHWEAAKMVPIRPWMLKGTWEKLDPATNERARAFSPRMGDVWKATEPGASLSFLFEGTRAAVYDLLGPDGGLLEVEVDDAPARTVARIDGFCTYARLATLPLGSLPAGVHRVRITLKPEAPDKAKILFEQNRPDLEKHPAKYRDHVWHASMLLLLGDLVEPSR
jgi:lysophospholipase L1-like esterase